MSTTQDRPFQLADRYDLPEGEVLLSGLQALVRVALVQRQIDAAAGVDSRVMVSGYEGSPLAGYDLELQRHRARLDASGVVHRPAVNEELGVDIVQGSQLASTLPGFRHDGVVGIWYGKAPGLDRATDALRHGNLGGASKHGGVLVLVGDDSTAKSSTVPSSSEVAMAEIGMAVLSPADPQEVLDLSLHGVALSRFSGLWCGVKLATNVVDGASTVTVRTPQIESVLPDRTIDGVPFAHEVTAHFLQPTLDRLEQSMVGARAELAVRYARANGLNRAEGDPAARLGIIVAGQAYRDTVQALTDLDIDLDAGGLRVLKLGLVHPLDVDAVTEFASGLDEIIVVEEKRANLELAVKDALFGRSVAVYGKKGPDGRPMLRAHSDLPPYLIAAALRPRLAARGIDVSQPTRQGSASARGLSGIRLLPLAARTPYFCSGCPHNRSTEVPDGSLVGAGIGCSALATYVNPARVGDITGLCQMGGEGVAWIGMAPFVEAEHLIQNLGDGTFHHSGSLAIRASVAAKSHITYKLLYNGAVAMTGGQQAEGRMAIPQVIASLLAEGVAKVAVTTEDPSRYKGVRLPKGVKVHHRDEILKVQNALKEIEGVTVLIHDQECATELRRKRKRGIVEAPTTRVFINTRVCEGCGDCGAKSNCLSVAPIDTPFGRKTQIHQSSCNQDYSCLDGDCPSFIAVEPAGPRPTRTWRAIDAATIPRPAITTTDVVSVRLMGIGGTGIVTTAQVLGVAATTAGLFVRSLDQLGMAQKGGAVVSDLRISREPIDGANKVEPGQCDLYLGADLLVAADDRNLVVADPDRTTTVLSTSRIPTGTIATNVEATFPDIDELTGKVRMRSSAAGFHVADARAVTEALFGSDQLANTLLLGMASQSGALPVRPEHLEAALEQNGVAVQANIEAFRWGRVLVADPGRVRGHIEDCMPPSLVPDPHSQRLAEPVLAKAGDDLRAALPRLVDELISYQDERYAARYLTHVGGVLEREQAVLGTSQLTTAFARNLFKLLAYKDEYEVARLSIDPTIEAEIKAAFGGDSTYAFKLHPPTLRALGLKSKISLPAAATRPMLRGLYALRRLRGTRLDPFGRAQVRVVERSLINEYVKNISAAMSVLNAQNADDVLRLIELPDMVRGYEHIKLANVERYRDEFARSLAGLVASAADAAY